MAVTETETQAARRLLAMRAPQGARVTSGLDAVDPEPAAPGTAVTPRAGDGSDLGALVPVPVAHTTPDSTTPGSSVQHERDVPANEPLLTHPAPSEET